jgi:predicted small secreted protein
MVGEDKFELLRCGYMDVAFAMLPLTRESDPDTGGVMRIQGGAVLIAVGLLVAGCNHVAVGEGVLSTGQKVAMVSTPGDSVSPPSTAVLYQPRPGAQYVPVAAGFGQAPLTAFVTGAGAGIAIGAGIAAHRPDVTNVSTTNNTTKNQAISAVNDCGNSTNSGVSCSVSAQ